MIINNCRVCGHKFFKKPLLRYKNMPKAAQFLPDAKSVKNDKGIDLEVCQCSGCGLVQLNNDPVPYYRQVIRATAFSPEMKDFRIKQFAVFVQKYSLKGRKVIEIGCGRGEYLSTIEQSGVEAYGIEASSKSAAYCRKQKLKVSKGFIKEDTKLSSAPFSAFFILSFFEHLPDPNSTLTGINNNLSDDGVGLVEVPNFDMILRKNLFSEFITDHLFYFSKETLKSTLMINGFEIIQCSEIWYDYIISAVVKKSETLYRPDLRRDWFMGKKLDISHFYKYQTKIKKDIRKYLRRFKDKKVAIWGAGHQALTVISMLNLSKKIKYVVDSAVFKQGKYTPATHIPIVSPESLDSNPVDAIIIMAASYSDEVAKILQQKYKIKIKIAILRDFGLEIVN